MAAGAHAADLNAVAAAPLPFALGIDLGGTKIAAALLAGDGREVWRQRVATPAGDYAATLQAIAALAAAAGAQAGGPFSIGIGAPGALSAGGRMKNCNSTCLNGRPLQADLQALLGQPVALANDANCLALSEATDGAGAGAAVVFAVIVGTGSGAGIAVHGRVLQGANGLAGEWAHNPLPWARTAAASVQAGPDGTDPVAADPQWRCYCGQTGCIETLVCGPGVARDHAEHHGDTLDAAAIAARAVAGDAACRATLDRHADRLARALASVINLLDPDVIVLGGGLSLMPHLYAEVPARWGRWVFSAGVDDPVQTRLLPALHGDASGVRGAAWLGRTAQDTPTRAVKR